MAIHASNYRVFESRSALWKAARDHLEHCREAMGLTQKEFARRAGVSLETYKVFVSKAGAISSEAAERFLGVLQGKDYSARPKLRHKIRLRKDQRWERVIWWPKEEGAKIEAYAKKYGVGVRTLIHIAVSRFIDEAPPMNTIKRVAKDVSAALARAELQENESLQYILEVDPHLAKLEAQRKPTPAVPDTEKTDVPIRTIARHAHRWKDGASDEIYLEDAEERELRTWLEGEGLEEL